MRKTLIIAEAGVNHNGDINLAKRLVDVAKKAGADIVKFQTAELDSLVSGSAKMADYQKRNLGQEESQKEMLSKLLLSYHEFLELEKYCRQVGIQFLSTPFDMKSIEFLDPLVGIWKIPSGEITNLPYLEKIARMSKPIILSTGMSDMEEVRSALKILRNNGAKDITLLHCTTEYPAPYGEVNLKAMQTLKEAFGCPIGYSDHTQGIEISVAAAAMGATVIEKHFTLDREMQGPDHKASLEPGELSSLVKAIRNVEMAIGDAKKEPTLSEMKNRTVARKSIVARREIREGEVFTEENITTKRPGSGISPMKWYEVIGKRAERDFQKDELVEVQIEKI